MLAVHHCSSKTRIMLCTALSGLMLAGCTGKDAKPSLLAMPPALTSDAGQQLQVMPQSELRSEPGIVSIRPAVITAEVADAELVTASVTGAVASDVAGKQVAASSRAMVIPRPKPAIPTRGKQTSASNAASKAAITTTSVNGEFRPAIVEAASSDAPIAAPTPKTSAWCRYLDANAEAKNAMLLAPTISATVDDKTNSSAKISYDVVDIARAKLEKRAAQAQCARFDASGRISRMLFITPQSLTYAGNLAKADYLSSASPELKAISNRIRLHVENGEMTAQLAAGMNQYIETVRSLEHHARAEAHRRETVGLLRAGDVRGLDVQLSEAERELAQIDRMSRTLDAVSVKLSAGINGGYRSTIDGRESNDFFDSDSAYAQVTVSYKLGALSPNRSKYERIAEEARVEALSETGHGALWRTAEMADALVRARRGLVVQRERIVAAIAEARANARKFSRGYEIELNQSKYRAQIDVIKLTAELRGIEGTLTDIDKVEQNLRFQ